MNEDGIDKCKYLSLSAGGTRGFMYLGAFRALSSLSRRFDSFLDRLEGIAGCSIGSLFGLILLLRIDLSRIEETLSPVLDSLKQIVPYPDLSLFANRYGLDAGLGVKRTIGLILKMGGVTDTCTLSDLKRLLRVDYVCVATNLMTQTPVHLRASTHPDMLVVDAVFASMCVPFLFTPVYIGGDPHVDGAMVERTPLFFPEETTLFLILRPSDPIHPTNLASYFELVTDCCLQTAIQMRDDLVQRETVIVLDTPRDLRGDLDLTMDTKTIRSLISCGYSTILLRFHPKTKEVLHLILAWLAALLVDE